MAFDVKTRPRKGSLGILYIVLIYAAAAILLVVPAVFLAFGIQALGGALGLWVGEATANDGEESWATIIGAVPFLAVLVGAGCGAWPVARRHGMRPLRTVTLASGVVVLGYVAWLVPLFS